MHCHLFKGLGKLKDINFINCWVLRVGVDILVRMEVLFFFESDLLSFEARPHIRLYMDIYYSSGPNSSSLPTPAALSIFVG